ncbi:MAG: type IV pili twitching motility protein PilT [Candidatus Moranbacteria bacterium RIFCSPHIGHO2_12_FULL_54_9]|nr:MAG: type IV pili twitching motility protein PilT [Candidatus Moranbacteria bacterium RIFCSPHIGHO2_01_FULL_54_31]OGI25014.1 MAG: type IV pili twitching motility protein PilT [Candidatus Moranbacteria bacterium RIFCSPHIGHO2_12_FULL_54_9]
METLHTEQRLKNLLLLVGQQGASDLHLVVGRYPTLRIDGKLHPIAQEKILTPADTKALSDVLLTEEKKQELIGMGQTDFSYNFEDRVRFRTNVFLQKGYVSVTMRFIMDRLRNLEELSIPSSLYGFTNYSQGLVLITGPVGHGKSTTLAAIIDYINHNLEKHIITIEDPIEFVYNQDRCIINQREIGRDAKNFPDALRAVFREDANVVLLGELRDLETISTAMTAAETGHLIFATLHTNDSAQTIDRIIDVFPAHQQNQIRSQLSSVLLGVISQRLLPRVGGGRIPAIEIMFKNQAVENLIRENKIHQLDSVIETGLKEGMMSLDRSLADLVRRGLISVNDAFIYAKNREYLQMLMSKE